MINNEISNPVSFIKIYLTELYCKLYIVSKLISFSRIYTDFLLFGTTIRLAIRT